MAEQSDLPKFAFIRFLQDNVKCVVKVCDIKRFNPKDIRDFPPEKVYMVKWSSGEDDDIDMVGDSDEEPEFYKAQILRLAVTKSQLEEQLASSRVRMPKVYDTSVEETTDDEDPETCEREVATLLKEKKAKKKQTEIAAASLKNALESRLKGMKSAPVFASTSIRKRPLEPGTDQGNDHMQKKLKEVRRELRTSQEETEKLRKKLSDTRVELSQHKDLNKRLQGALLLKIETSGKEHRSIGHSRPPEPELSPAEPSFRSSKESPSTSGATSNLEEKNGKIHIDADIWIATEKWAAISSQTKHSMFVKNMMVAIWGSSVLQGRSLDGKACPRFKGDRVAKPPLSPEKVTAMKRQFMKRLDSMCNDSTSRREEASKFNKYVTEKLQDVNRSQQRMAKSSSSRQDQDLKSMNETSTDISEPWKIWS